MTVFAGLSLRPPGLLILWPWVGSLDQHPPSSWEPPFCSLSVSSAFSDSACKRDHTAPVFSNLSRSVQGPQILMSSPIPWEWFKDLWVHHSWSGASPCAVGATVGSGWPPNQGSPVAQGDVLRGKWDLTQGTVLREVMSEPRPEGVQGAATLASLVRSWGQCPGTGTSWADLRTRRAARRSKWPEDGVELRTGPGASCTRGRMFTLPTVAFTVIGDFAYFCLKGSLKVLGGEGLENHPHSSGEVWRIGQRWDLGDSWSYSKNNTEGRAIFQWVWMGKEPSLNARLQSEKWTQAFEWSRQFCPPRTSHLMFLCPVLTAWASNLITTPLSNCRSEGTPVSCHSLLHPHLAGGPTAELGHVSHHPFPTACCLRTGLEAQGC